MRTRRPSAGPLIVSKWATGVGCYAPRAPGRSTGHARTIDILTHCRERKVEAACDFLQKHIRDAGDEPDVLSDWGERATPARHGWIGVLFPVREA